MKTRLQKIITPALTVCALLAGFSRADSQTLVQVDPSKTWVGYMSWSPVPGDAAGYGGNGGGSWGTAALQAAFSGNTLLLSPNTNVYNPASPYWVNADGSGANNMDASFYVQNDLLVTQNVTFAGTCVDNTLAAGYSSQAFIKIFNGSYSLLGKVTSNLVAGQTFLIATSAIPGAAHVQYGFETIGPDANPATAPGLGQVTIAVPVGAYVQTDPNKFWAGYMNWSAEPYDAGGYGGNGGGAWGPKDLQAYFATNNTLNLLPNTNAYNPASPYWVNADGSGANNMDANFYVTDDTLSNTNVIFTGYCISNSLASNYTAQAFIKIFNSGYGNLGASYSGNLVPGQSFIINLDTTGAAHVQYGFVTDGPDANPTNQPDLGQAIIAAAVPVAPPAVLLIPTNNAATPAWPSATVVAMYDSSSVYPDSPGIGWYASWGSTTSQGDFTITNTGAIVKNYAGLQYAGMEFYGNPINVASGFDTFHIDVWTPNANQLGVKLVSLTAGTQDPQVNVAITVSNRWTGIDIPLSAFSAIRADWDPSNLQQMLLVDNSTAGAGVQGGTFYVDNAYFYNSTAGTGPLIAASIASGSVQLSFLTLNGSSYDIQYKTNLTDAVWQTLTTISGNGSTQTFSESADQASRFYRVYVH